MAGIMLSCVKCRIPWQPEINPSLTFSVVCGIVQECVDVVGEGGAVCKQYIRQLIWASPAACREDGEIRDLTEVTTDEVTVPTTALHRDGRFSLPYVQSLFM